MSEPVVSRLEFTDGVLLVGSTYHHSLWNSLQCVCVLEPCPMRPESVLVLADQCTYMYIVHVCTCIIHVD
jgi:hypothetical protein